MQNKIVSKNTPNFMRMVQTVVVVATGWVFFEWLFFVTKPSFISAFSWPEKIEVLCSSALIITAGLLLISLPFFALARFLGWLNRWQSTITIAAFFPAILLMAMAMLVVIDNFTLTLFGWGIRNASDTAIYAYRAVTVVLLALAVLSLRALLFKDTSTGTLNFLSIVAGVILAGSATLLLSLATRPGEQDLKITNEGSDLPNIIILSGDGLATSHMSVYGYDRPTTPFMDSARDEFLISENHFTNASDTGGSVISLLSGKLPTSTRVIYPPDVLRGEDAYQHLPGILKKLGYYNADISMRHYADPYDLNLRNGFDEANFRQLKETGGTLIAKIREYPVLNPASMLIDRMSERVSERFDHIWKDKPMQDPLAEVNVPDRRWIRDPARMVEVRRIIESAPRPFFVNVHMMGTHGERFKPTRRVYSTEDDYLTPWHLGGYDDAMMDFDRNVEETYQLLKDNDLLNSTIFIVSSDHGFKHNSLERLPLLIRLPGQAKTGLLGGNTQRLDISATLLDAIGIEPRDWMEGRSLLDPELELTGKRMIFASGSINDKIPGDGRWTVRLPSAPWYSMGRLFLIYCDQGFTLRLNTMELTGGNIPGSSMDCENPLSIDEAREIMLTHLKQSGYSWD